MHRIACSAFWRCGSGVCLSNSASHSVKRRPWCTGSRRSRYRTPPARIPPKTTRNSTKQYFFFICLPITRFQVIHCPSVPKSRLRDLLRQMRVTHLTPRDRIHQVHMALDQLGKRLLHAIRRVFPQQLNVRTWIHLPVSWTLLPKSDIDSAGRTVLTFSS